MMEVSLSAATLDDKIQLQDCEFVSNHHCHNCLKPDDSALGLLIQCAKCKSAYYCSSRCFNEHLPTHILVCGKGALSSQLKPNAVDLIAFGARSVRDVCTIQDTNQIHVTKFANNRPSDRRTKKLKRGKRQSYIDRKNQRGTPEKDHNCITKSCKYAESGCPIDEADGNAKRNMKILGGSTIGEHTDRDWSHDSLPSGLESEKHDSTYSLHGMEYDSTIVVCEGTKKCSNSAGLRSKRGWSNDAVIKLANSPVCVAFDSLNEIKNPKARLGSNLSLRSGREWSQDIIPTPQCSQCEEKSSLCWVCEKYFSGSDDDTSRPKCDVCRSAANSSHDYQPFLMQSEDQATSRVVATDQKSINTCSGNMNLRSGRDWSSDVLRTDSRAHQDQFITSFDGNKVETEAEMLWKRRNAEMDDYVSVLANVAGIGMPISSTRKASNCFTTTCQDSASVEAVDSNTISNSARSINMSMRSGRDWSIDTPSFATSNMAAYNSTGTIENDYDLSEHKLMMQSPNPSSLQVVQNDPKSHNTSTDNINLRPGRDWSTDVEEHLINRYERTKDEREAEIAWNRRITNDYAPEPYLSVLANVAGIRMPIGSMKKTSKNKAAGTCVDQGLSSCMINQDSAVQGANEHNPKAITTRNINMNRRSGRDWASDTPRFAENNRVVSNNADNEEGYKRVEEQNQTHLMQAQDSASTVQHNPKSKMADDKRQSSRLQCINGKVSSKVTTGMPNYNDRHYDGDLRTSVIHKKGREFHSMTPVASSSMGVITNKNNKKGFRIKPDWVLNPPVRKTIRLKMLVQHQILMDPKVANKLEMDLSDGTTDISEVSEEDIDTMIAHLHELHFFDNNDQCNPVHGVSLRPLAGSVKVIEKRNIGWEKPEWTQKNMLHRSVAAGSLNQLNHHHNENEKKPVSSQGMLRTVSLGSYGLDSSTSVTLSSALSSTKNIGWEKPDWVQKKMLRRSVIGQLLEEEKGSLRTQLDDIEKEDISSHHKIPDWVRRSLLK